MKITNDENKKNLRRGGRKIKQENFPLPLSLTTIKSSIILTPFKIFKEVSNPKLGPTNRFFMLERYSRQQPSFLYKIPG